jgi:hypothetical protein
MKQLLSILFISAAITAVSQPKKAPKMAPVLAPGYYVNTQKSDTVKGEVMTNPENDVDLYKGFSFRPAKGGKVMPVTTKKAKAYGFEGRNFVLIVNDGADIYVEVLARGRLNFYEYKYDGKIDGYPAVEYAYFIQDNMAEGADAGLKELKKISNKFYKKDLKPYMKEQPMIWTDFDKFTFDKQKVTAAIQEFNKFYVITPDPDKDK